MTASKDPNVVKGNLGEEITKAYLLKMLHYDDVEVVKGKGIGFDLLATKRGKTLKVEVKCSSTEHDIPDCYRDEFDSEQKLRADQFWIVRVTKKRVFRRFEVLAKDEVDAFASKHHPVERLQIASGLKTALKDRKVGRVIE